MNKPNQTDESLFANRWVQIGLLAGVIALVVVAVFLVTMDDPFAPEASTDGELDYADQVEFNPEDKGLGDPDAPLVITEYVDFQCRFCAQQALETFPHLLEDHIKTGNVYYRFRHFPLPMHPHAEEAALGSECALEQGKFWEYKRTMMVDQDQISPEFIQDMGDRLDMPDPGVYRQCVQQQDHMERVNSDRRGGNLRGVEATPTILLNGEELRGAVPYEILDEQIRQLL